MKRTMKNIEIGSTFTTNQGCDVTVTSIVNFKNIGVTYNDDFKHTTITSLQHLNAGNLKNPYYPSVFNIGYIGVGPYKSSINGGNTVVYDAWRNMLKRCYCEIYQSSQPTYIGCSVDPTWLNFQTFAHWYCNQPNYGKGYHLDKDIVFEGNKIYGPQYCTLVPEVINSLFSDRGRRSVSRHLPTGVYEHGVKYQAECNNVFLGTFDTVGDAELAYIIHKRNFILSVIEQYKHDLDIDVYYALYALAYSL